MLLLLALSCAPPPPLSAPPPNAGTYGPAPAAQPRVQGVEGLEKHTSPSGLTWWVLREGTGPTPAPGQTAVAHYTGWLADGTQFDSSVERGEPLRVEVGKGQVIKGWDEALQSMKVGEKRRLLVPPQIGYGERAVGPIPAGATLIFDVELLGIE